MATTPQQGIMALPETDEATTPQLSLNESYGAAKEGLADANPQYAAMYQEEMSKVMPTLMALSDQELDTLLQLIQYLQDHPEEYTQRVQEMEADGTIEKGALPAEYDENFLAVFGAAILEAQRTNEDTGTAAPAMQPPMQLAKGGIAEAARMVASHGRTGDTMLAHITKDEAALLKKHGGVGTRNPRTGLREYGLWSSVKGAVKSVAGGLGISKALSTVGKAVKGVLNSTVGRIVATVALAAFLGPGAFSITGMGLGATASMGLASAGITALSGGNLKDVVKAGVTGAIAGFGAEVLGPALGTATGVSNAAGQAAMGAGAASTGSGLLQGKSIKDSVKDGMTSAAIAGLMTGSTQGFDAQVKPNNAPVSDATSKPVDVASTNVNAQTGQVTGGAPVQPPAPASLASSNQAFEQALANQNPINGLTMDNGLTMNNGLTGVQPPVAQGPAPQGPWTDATGAQIRPDAARFDQLMNDVSGPGPVGSRPATESSMWDTFGKKYDELNLSPSSREAAGAAEAQQKGLEAVAKLRADGAAGNIRVTPEMETAAFNNAVKANTPGMMSNYAPAIGMGLGATYLAGGFNSDQPSPSQESQDVYSGKAARDIIAADPTKYLTQNLPGVSYDAAGNITGSGSWTPRSGAATTTVPGNYIAYTPTQAPAGLPSLAPAMQRTPVASYGNMPQYDFTPRYAAQGGFMETQGAFPANPLTMQSSPMMAMDAHRLPMNTPGVPMNTPMGYANGGMPVGGIASLAVGGYPRRTGQISGPGTPTSDDIPAMLSDGEFVFTEKAVRGMGNGSRRAGAKKMYALMHHLEKNAARG